MSKTRIIVASVIIFLLGLSMGFVILYPYNNAELPNDTNDSFEQQGTEGLIYKLDGDGKSYTLIGYEGDAVDILVPTYYEGLPVLEIAEGAFWGKNIWRAQMKLANFRFFWMHLCREAPTPWKLKTDRGRNWFLAIFG